jgi:thioredoxin 1
MTRTLATSLLERRQTGRMTSIELTVPYVDAEGFDSLVEGAPGLVLVDFTADWCPPCRRLAPDIGALANERTGSLTVVKVDADEQPDLTARFSVRGLPTLMFFRGGKVVDRILGAPSPAQLRSKVDELR